MAKPSGTRVTPEIAAFVRLMFDDGRSVSTIADRVRVSRSTVRYWLKRQTAAVPERRPVFPRKTVRKVDARRALVVKIAGKTVTRGGKLRPAFCTAASIAKELMLKHGIRASRWTVRRDLTQRGFVPRVRKYVPTTAVSDHTRRWRFVRSSKTRKAFRRLVFTDEKIFTTNDYGSRTQWVPRGDAPLGREHGRFPPRVMIWAAIGPNFVVWKVLQNPALVAGTGVNERKTFVLNADSYVRTCLPLIVPHLTKERLVLQQDGAKPHTAKQTSAYLKRKGVEMLENWPARSPDLNPIETLWAYVQRRVSDHFPTTYDELIAAINFEFNQIRDSDIDVVNRLIASFEKRCKAVAKKQGRV